MKIIHLILSIFQFRTIYYIHFLILLLDLPILQWILNNIHYFLLCILETRELFSIISIHQLLQDHHQVPQYQDNNNQQHLATLHLHFSIRDSSFYHQLFGDCWLYLKQHRYWILDTWLHLLLPFFLEIEACVHSIELIILKVNLQVFNKWEFRI